MDVDAFKRAIRTSQQIVDNAKSLHLASIAKSIEQKEGCQIFIMPRNDIDYQSCLATAEPYIVLDIEDPAFKETAFKIRQHFILYKSCPESAEAERFRVAHELGHCALHWPLESRKNRIWERSMPNVGKVYLVDFTKEEEEEADAFACFLGLNRPAPSNRNDKLEVNELLLMKTAEYQAKGFLQSMFV